MLPVCGSDAYQRRRCLRCSVFVWSWCPYLIYQPDGVSLEEGRDEAAYMIAVTRSRLGKGESKL